ncbi:sulfatase-like hydrolase/transferase [Streptomyces oceani]|uniref:sulfatase-like hydrolase/transferase n=1 Tax=Streptomyces oceani TaxID=1075402 RepID=UPI000872E7F6|nr:sulfatase-like hydrolase/transferase [Streptomyces oceani]
MPDQPLRPEDTTLAEVLRSAGYATGLFGKWGFCPERAQHFSHPNNKGFGTYFGMNSHAAAHEYYPTEVWDNDHVHRIEGNENGGQRVYSGPVPGACARVPRSTSA